jgi:phosphate transport system substrate-binding protein
MALCAAALAFMPVVASMSGAQTVTRTNPPARPLVVAGSSTMSPLMADIARRFEGLHAGISVEVRSVGSGKGIADLRAEAADVAMVSRPLSNSERDLFGFPLCRAGAAISVHRSNPLKGLNDRQLTEILTGSITDWKQLGVRSGAIKLAWRAEGQGIVELLLQQLKLKSAQIRGHSTLFDNEDAIGFVAADRDAVSVVAIGVAEHSAKSGAAIRLLAFDDVAASTRTIRDHTYPLSRPLILVTRGVPTGLQKRFVDYAVSEAVTDLHEKHGFVSYAE